MTSLLHSQLFKGSAGVVHGCVRLVTLPYCGKCALEASLACEKPNNPQILLSPSYSATFGAEDIKRAIRAMRSAARRRNLAPLPVN